MIKVDYIPSQQLCRITTSRQDRAWKDIRLQFNQISDQSKIAEDSIELPWHAFIANTELFQFLQQYHEIVFELSPAAEAYLRESLQKKSQFKYDR